MKERRETLMKNINHWHPVCDNVIQIGILHCLCAQLNGHTDRYHMWVVVGSVFAIHKNEDDW